VVDDRLGGAKRQPPIGAQTRAPRFALALWASGFVRAEDRPSPTSLVLDEHGRSRWSPDIDPLQVDAGRAEVAVTEPALDDVHRYSLSGELYCVRVRWGPLRELDAELMWL
jgi:hypothetical protein